MCVCLLILFLTSLSFSFKKAEGIHFTGIGSSDSCPVSRCFFFLRDNSNWPKTGGKSLRLRKEAAFKSLWDSWSKLLRRVDSSIFLSLSSISAARNGNIFLKGLILKISHRAV